MIRISGAWGNLLYHIVFSTRYREPWLKGPVAIRIHEYLGGVIRDEGGVPIIVNGVEDHVHLLARLRQDIAVRDVLRVLKAKSSGWVHRTLPDMESFAWQKGYGALSVSASQLERVRHYIVHQQEHNRETMFQEEFVALLRLNEVEYDPRSIWDG